MRWKKISKLTEAEFDDVVMHHRLMVWNSCNGPHHIRGCDGYFSADEIKAEGVWEKYLVLPKAAA